MSKQFRAGAIVETKIGRMSIITCLAVLLCVLPTAVQAQILYGSLTGNVTDQSGAVVPSAKVEAVNVQTGVVREVTATDAGTYLFAELQPGAYKITVTVKGFSPTAVENVQVAVNAVRRVDVQLKVGTVTETVTVSSTAELMQTDRADVHTNLTVKEIQNLPISSSEGRSWQSLYNLIPGATPTVEANSQAGNPQRAMNTNVNGGSNQTNNTRIDGVQNAYPWLPANIAYVPPADAIETVNVVTNSFDAEQGMAGGMAANVQIKSGTNQFHGSGHIFHTDQTLRAENYFQPQTTFNPVLQKTVPFQKPKNIQNQFGYTIGGPIKKDKLFFFTDFERTTQRQFATKLLTVPTDAMRNGDFSALVAGVNCNDHNAADANHATANCIYNPNTGNANGTGRLAYANNQIPGNLIDPAALTLLKLIPEPNIPITNPANPAGDYFATGGAQFNRNDLDAKINYVPNDRSMIFGRYSISSSFIFDPPALGQAGGDATNGGSQGNAYGRVQNIGMGGTYTISPNMLVDANFGYTRQRLSAYDTDLGSNFGLDTLHIPGTNGSDPLQAGIPAFQFTTWANLGNAGTGNPFLFRDNQYVSNANLSWNKKKHAMRFGIEFNRSGINHFQPQGGAFQTARGSFRFFGQSNAGPTVYNSAAGEVINAGNQITSWASYLLGLPSEVGKAVQNTNPNSLRWSEWSLYARDQWQLRSNLTLNYGLRWERYPFVTSDHGGARLLDPATMNVLIGGHGSVPLDDNVSIGPGLFLPRVGIAYRPLKNTVIRAGYGMSADANNWRFFRNAFPAVTISDFTGLNGLAFAPAGSLSGTNATLTPYGTIPVGITGIPLPDISSGVIPLPSGTSTTTAAENFRRGYTHTFNLTVEHEFAGFVANVGYVGSRSIRPLTNMNINPAPIGGGQNGRILNAQFGKNWGDINSLTPFGNSYYDSLQTTLMRRFKGNSFIGVAYTRSKAIDFSDNEELNFLLFPFPAYANKARGLASYDRPNNLRLYGAYDLPFGRNQRWATSGVLNHILGGWQTNWILSKVSGTPMTITANNSGFNAPGNTETANQIAPIQILGNTPMLNCQQSGNPLSCSYFNQASFAAPTGAVFGNMGRDVVRGPGFFNLDMSLFRTFKLTERFSLQCRGEAFGLTNTPHFNNPASTTVGATNFGIITGSSGERTVWVAAKVLF